MKKLWSLAILAVLAGCQSWSSQDKTTSQPTTSARAAKQTEQQAKIPVVKEELQVGKRQVPSGKAEVQTRTKKEQVQENIPLREEQVTVERKPAGREPKPGEAEQAFKEQSVEMTETREEPVISKRPRVTEEITMRKEAGERTETVNESVRSTDVDVQGSQEVKASMGLSRYEQDFLQHYSSHFSEAGSYDDYQPAYHYGYGLATRGGGNWSDIESQAQRNWEDQHPGSWDRFQPAIKYGWEKAKQGKG